MILQWMPQLLKNLFNVQLDTFALRRHLITLKISARHQNIVRLDPQLHLIALLENIATHMDYLMVNLAMADTSVKGKQKFQTQMTQVLLESNAKKVIIASLELLNLNLVQSVPITIKKELIIKFSV